MLHAESQPRRVSSRTISWQADIRGWNGAPLPDGQHVISVRLYLGDSSSSPFYTEDQITTTYGGHVDILIGTINPIPVSGALGTFSLLSNDSTLYLGISVDGGTEITPRTPIAAAPLALHALAADLARELAPGAKGAVTSINESGGAVHIAGDSTLLVTTQGGTISLSSRVPMAPGLLHRLDPADSSISVQDPSGPTTKIALSAGGVTAEHLGRGAVHLSHMSDSGASFGDIMKFDGQSWRFAKDADTKYVGGPGILISGDTVYSRFPPPNPRLVSSTLRSDGTRFVEDTLVLANSAGDLSVTGSVDATGLRLRDSLRLLKYRSGLLRTNSSGAVTTSSVNAAQDITGVLPVMQGGTGVDSLKRGEVLIGNNTSPVTTAALEGANGVQVTTSLGKLTISNVNALPSGSRQDATLRWNGQVWVEDTAVRVTASGDVTLRDLGARAVTASSVNGSSVSTSLVNASSVNASDISASSVSSSVLTADSISTTALQAARLRTSTLTATQVHAQMLEISGKATSAPTLTTDGDSTLVTKGYLAAAGHAAVLTDRSTLAGSGTNADPLRLDTTHSNIWQTRQTFNAGLTSNGSITLAGSTGSARDVLTSGGTGVAPSWTSVNALVDSVSFSKLTTGTISNSSLTIGAGSSLTFSGNGSIAANRFRGSGSTSDAVDLATSEVAGLLPVSNGGTGAGAFNPGEILLGNGTGAVTSAALEGNNGISINASNGQIVIGNTNALPGGTTTGSTLRWNGSTWQENTGLRASASGDLAGDTLTANNVTASSANANSITSGSITATNLSATTATATSLTASSLTATTLTATNLSATTTSGGAISGTSLNLGGKATSASTTLTDAGNTLVTKDFVTNAGNIGVLSDGTTLIGDGSALNRLRLNPANQNSWTALQTFQGGLSLSGTLTLGGTNGSSGNVLVSQGAATPQWQSVDNLISGLSFDKITDGSNAHKLTVTSGGVLATSGTGVIAANRFIGAGSLTDAVDLATTEVSGVLPIANGGTGVSALNPNAILLGGTTSISSQILSSGQLLIGATGSAPVAATLQAGSGIQITNGPGAITIATSNAVPAGTTTNATLRWNGSYWVENPTVLESSAGAITGASLVLSGKALSSSTTGSDAGQTLVTKDFVTGVGNIGVQTDASTILGSGLSAAPIRLNLSAINTWSGSQSFSGGVSLTGTASPLTVRGTDGTSGYVLTSQGAGSTPSWSDPASIFSSLGFDRLTSGTNVSAAMTVGDGASITPSGTGSVTANYFAGAGSITNAVDLSTSEVSGVLPVQNGGTGSSALTSNAILIGNGTAAIQSIALGDGQVLMGRTGAIPQAATLTGGSGISITTAAGFVTLAANAQTDATLLGNATNSNPLRLDLSHANTWSSLQGFNAGLTLAGASSPLVLNTSAGAAGNVLTSAGAGGTPVWSDPSSLVDSIGFDKLTSATNTAAAMVVGSGATLRPSGSGAIAATEFVGSGSTSPAVDLPTSEVSGVLPLANGGTGVSTLASNGVVISNGTTLDTRTLGDGELLIGSAGTVPHIGTLTAGAGIEITNGAGSITISAPAAISDGSALNSILRWNGSAWVEDANVRATASGDVAMSALTLSGKASSASTVTADPAQTLVTKDFVMTPGNAPGISDHTTLSGSGVAGDPYALSLSHANTWASLQSFSTGIDLTGSSSSISLSGSAGTSGYVLTSQGAGQTPVWTNPSQFLNSLTFDKLSSGTNTSATLSVGTGAVLAPTGSGSIVANAFTGSGSLSNAVDLATAEVNGVLPVFNGGSGASTLQNNGIVVAHGTAALTATALANGQIMVGSTGGAPVATTITAGPGVTVINAPGSITLSAIGTISDGTQQNSTLRWNGTNWVENTAVSATAAGGLNAATLTLSGKATAVSTTSADPASTLVTKDFVTSAGNIPIVSDAQSLIGDGTSANALRLNQSHANSWQVGQSFTSGLTLTGSASPIILGASSGTANQVLVSQGAGTTPAWSNISALLPSVTFGDLASGTNTTAAMTVGSGASLVASGTGRIAATALAGNGSTSDAVDLATGEVSGVLNVANGGTGVTSLPHNEVLIGNSSNGLASVALADGELLIGSSGNAPQAATLTSGAGISITNASGAITIAATSGMPAGSSTNSTLRWNDTSWVENPSLQASASGAVSAASLILSGKASTASTESSDAANTLVTKDFVTTAGNVSVSHGATLTGNGTTNAPIDFDLGHANVWTSEQSLDSGISLSGSASPLKLAGSAGSAGQILVSQGLAATPAWRDMSTLLPQVTFDHIGSGTNTSSSLSVGTGASITPSGSGVITANSYDGILGVTNGGTGAATLPAHGILVGNGSSPVSAKTLANGELMIGANSSEPVAAALTAGSGISITNGPGAITIAATSGMPTGTQTNSTLHWTGGTWSENVSVREGPSGDISASTLDLSGKATSASTQVTDLGQTLVTKDYLASAGHVASERDQSLIGNGTNSSPLGLDLDHSNHWSANQSYSSGVALTGTTSPLSLGGSDGTTGQILTSQGAGSTPIWSNPSALVTSLPFDKLSTATNTSAVMMIGTGASLAPAGSGRITANDYSGVLPVSNGGTGVSSLPAHSVLLGGGSSLASASLGSGELLVGVSGSDPVPTALTAGSGITITNGGGNITIAAIGQLPSGTTQNSTLRWTGSAWSENTSVQANASGSISASTLALTGKASSASTSNSDPGSTLVTKDYLSTSGNTAVAVDATLTGNGASLTPLGIDLSHPNTWSSQQTFSNGLALTSSSELVANGSSGSSGMVLTSRGAGQSPTWQNASSLSNVGFDHVTSASNSNQSLVIGNGSSLTASGTGSIVATSLQGSGSTTSAVDLATAEVNGVLPIANGGTNNSATPTAGAIAYGNGTQIVYTAAGSAGQVLVSQGSGAPIWQTSNVTGWSLTGNGSTVPGTNFIGTTDAQPFEIHVHESGQSSQGRRRVARFEPTNESPNLVFGFSGNSVMSGVSGGAILSGGSASQQNIVTDDYGLILGGKGNQAGNYAGTTNDEEFAVAVGGHSNTAAAEFSFIGGGEVNSVYDRYGVIAGGYQNAVGVNDGSTTNQDYSTIGGGGHNLATASYATVAGGFTNTASGGYSTISGGQSNTSSGTNSVVAGGQSNTVSTGTISSTVSGGATNVITADYGTVAGGQNNRVTDANGTVSGGANNLAGDAAGTAVDETYATVSGGYTNSAKGSYSSISGGSTNTANGDYSMISGGNSNQTFGSYSAIAGGSLNRTAGLYAFIGGGTYDTAYGISGTVAGGSRNSVTDDYSVVVGGSNNMAGNGTASTNDKSYATVTGGYSNQAAGAYSIVAGGRNLSVGDYSFGFNGDNSGTQTDLRTLTNTAYFGNVTLALGNVDNAARELRWYAPNTSMSLSGAHYTGIKAGAATSNTTYTLPTAAPSSTGALMASSSSGVMSWTNNLVYDASNSRVGVGTAIPGATLDVAGDVAYRSTGFTAANGNNNNINVGSYSFVRITGPSGNFDITGISSATDGKLLVLFNATSQTMTVRYNSGLSSTANRILNANGNDVAVGQYGVVQLLYSGTDSRWIVIGHN